MWRAYEVRKASIQKTGAAKAKLYSMYAREIYQIAKNGGTEPTGNPSLKRIIEKAKKEQVPQDIIKRAIDKVNSGAGENYETVKYELFGPSGSTLIVECLTDNLNRSVSSVRAVINKCKSKMGSMGSVSFNYDHLCIIGFKGITPDETLELLIEDGIDVIDIEEDENLVIVYGNPQDSQLIKDSISKKVPSIDFEIDEISMLPKEKITLDNENLELFNKLLVMLDDIEDVNKVYHNVEI